jgi:hypothetical protein
MHWTKVCLIVLLFIALLVSGCVSKSTFEKAQSDLATAQQSLSATIADRDSTKAQLVKVQSDFTTAQLSLSSVTTDRDTTKTQLVTVTTDRDTTKAQLVKVQSDFTTAQLSLSSVTTDRDTTKTQLVKAQSDLATLKASIKTAQPYVDIASAYLKLAVAGLNGSSPDALAAYSQITLGFSAANDSKLQAAWDDLVANSLNEAASISFIKLLAQRLSDTKPNTN